MRLLQILDFNTYVHHMPHKAVLAPKVYGFVAYGSNEDSSNTCPAFDRKLYAPLATFGRNAQAGEVTGQIVRVNPILADSDLQNPEALLGNLAFVNRGGCPFPEKAKRCQAAGAIGLIVANNDTVKPALAFTMSEMKFGEAEGIRIPCVMLSVTHTLELTSYLQNTLCPSVRIELLEPRQVKCWQQRQKQKGVQERCPQKSTPKAIVQSVPVVDLKSIEAYTGVDTEVDTKVDTKEEHVVRQWIAPPSKPYTFIRWTDQDAEHYYLHYAPLACFGAWVNTTLCGIDHDLQGPLILCDPPLANVPALGNAPQLRGSIVLVERGGGVTFVQKIARVQAAGALGVIVLNNDLENPDAAFVMSTDLECGDHITIPCVMVSANVAALLRTRLDHHHSKMWGTVVAVPSFTMQAVLEQPTTRYSALDLPPNLPFTASGNIPSSPLPSACRDAQFDIVVEILHHTPNLQDRERPDAWGLTPLHQCAISGQAPLVTLVLLDCSPGYLDQRDLAGNTALHYACLFQHLEIVQLLVRKMNSFNCAASTVVNVLGCTPVHVAAYVGHLAVLELLKPHFPLSEVDYAGQSALHYACREGHVACIQYWLHQCKSSGFNPLPTIVNAQALIQALNDGKVEPGEARETLTHMCFPLQRAEEQVFDKVADDSTRQYLERLYLRNQVSQLQHVQTQVQDQASALKCALEQENQELRRQMKSSLKNQATLAQQLQIVQEKVKALTLHRQQALPNLLQEGAWINTEKDNTMTEQERAEEAAFARELGKKYARSRQFSAALECLDQSLALYPLPGVMRLRQQVLQQQQSEISLQSPENEEEDEEAPDCIKHHQCLASIVPALRANGATDQALGWISRELTRVLPVESKETVQDWLEWLLECCPWTLMTESSCSMDMFQQLDCHNNSSPAGSVEKNEHVEERTVYDHNREDETAAAKCIQHAYLRFLEGRVKETQKAKAAMCIQAQIRRFCRKQVTAECLDKSLDPQAYGSTVDHHVPPQWQSSQVLEGIHLHDPRSKRYYVLQLLESRPTLTECLMYLVWHRWGNSSSPQFETRVQGPYDSTFVAEIEFERVFRMKTKNVWSQWTQKKLFRPYPRALVPSSWTTSTSDELLLTSERLMKADRLPLSTTNNQTTHSC